jgi:hypothetical protein
VGRAEIEIARIQELMQSESLEYMGYLSFSHMILPRGAPRLHPHGDWAVRKHFGDLLRFRMCKLRKLKIYLAKLKKLYYCDYRT